MAGTKKKTTKSLIYQHLRRAIITDQHSPGDRLDVEAIAGEFGTSVSPVRDALQMLSQDGLVTIRPQSGYFVTHLTLKQLRDLLELREILEIAAIERAVEKISDEQIDHLESVHGQYTGDDPISYDRYTDENRNFHVSLAEASGNFELTQQIGKVHDRLARFMVLSHSGKTMKAGHGMIIQALRKKSTTMARKRLQKEIQSTHQYILDRVMSEEADRWTVK